MKRARDVVEFLQKTFAATANDEQLDPRNLDMVHSQEISDETRREIEEQDPMLDKREGPLYMKWKTFQITEEDLEETFESAGDMNGKAISLNDEQKEVLRIAFCGPTRRSLSS